MVRHYFPGLAPETLTDEELFERWVQTQWLEDRQHRNSKIAVNHGMAGKD